VQDAELAAKTARFLRSVKASEKLESDLLPYLHVDILGNSADVDSLDLTLARTLSAGRDVFVTGSAGSGKTHLVSRVLNGHEAHLPRVVTFGHEEPTDEQYIRYVPDLTAVPANKRLDAVQDRPSNLLAILLAGNEGPLLDLARRMGSQVADTVVQHLHSAQQGIQLPHDSTAPIVVDAAGFDPVVNKVVAQMVTLPAVRAAVASTPCECVDQSSCPRRLAWQLLQIDEVRVRLADLLRLANLEGEPVLFRDLWDFVADLALNGECSGDIPTGAWFWRVFHGASRLSRKLRDVVDPKTAVIPRLDPRLYHGDWDKVDDYLLEGSFAVELPTPPPHPGHEFSWIKSQFFFTYKYSRPWDLVKNDVDIRLLQSIEQGDVGKLVETINSYISYGTLRSQRSHLYLLSNLMVERRNEKPASEFSLGFVDSSELEITRSHALSNAGDAVPCIAGSVAFLVHKASNSSLKLTPELLDLLASGRSTRTSDRKHVDAEWHLGQFFYSIAKTRSASRELEVYDIDFTTGHVERRSYNISSDYSQIERIA
jgi:hypothetical protein